jgi:hypothetical protein
MTNLRQGYPRSFAGWLSITAVLSLFFSMPASAITMKNLYEVKIPVKNQSSDERQKSIREAFGVLLVRLTGNEGINSMEQVIALTEKADQYVRQFRYEQEPVPLLEHYKKEQAERARIAEEEGFSMLPNLREPISHDEETRQVLSVAFDEMAVNKLIWSNRLPFWSKTRPSTIVWLAIQDEQERFLLDANQPSVFLDVLRRAARERGIPLVFPLQDLQDQISINVGDVWGNFESTIRKASTRYETESILTGRLLRDPTGIWRGRWTVLRGNERFDYVIEHTELEFTVAEGVRSLANGLATRYAHVTTGEEEDQSFTMFIADVKDVGDYHRATQHVNSLTAVASTQVAKVSADQIVLKLHLRGNREALEQAVKLGGKLAVQPGADASDKELYYRLQP